MVSTNETMWQDPHFCGESWVHVPNMYIYWDFQFLRVIFWMWNSIRGTAASVLHLILVRPLYGSGGKPGTARLSNWLNLRFLWPTFDMKVCMVRIVLDIRATTVLSSSSNGLSLSGSLSLLKVWPSECSWPVSPYASALPVFSLAGLLGAGSEYPHI
jgi:hypothetical protein